MKILNKIVEFIESLISKVRKPVHLEVPETTVESVEKPVEVPETSEKKVETVEKPVKTAKRRGRPRKVKAE